MRQSTRTCDNPPTRRNGALFDKAKQPRLQFYAEIPDLIEEQRASVRRLDQSFLHALSARERAALVAEQFALDQ